MAYQGEPVGPNAEQLKGLQSIDRQIDVGLMERLYNDELDFRPGFDIKEVSWRKMGHWALGVGLQGLDIGCRCVAAVFGSMPTPVESENEQTSESHTS